MPTGIDRVCLAYMEHFGPNALALVKRGELRLLLNRQQSDELFRLLLHRRKGFRAQVSVLLVRAAVRQSGEDVAGKIYLNIGHTGLDAAGYPAWIRRKKLRPVFFVHDLIPITHPEYCRAGEDVKHSARMANVLQCAAGIIANSKATADAITLCAQRRGLPLPNTLVAWLGIDEHSGLGDLEPLSRPYFVIIGTIEARKNHLLLLHVWERLITRFGDKTPALVLVGQRGWEADDVFALLDRSSILRGHVRELGRCNDAQMIAVLDGAQALLMPSFIEGFGIPVIEALQRGTPVIASDLPVFREIAGDIPLYLDPLDGQSWEKAVEQFIDDCPERQRQLARMGEFEAPTWAGHFAAVDRWITSL